MLSENVLLTTLKYTLTDVATSGFLGSTLDVSISGIQDLIVRTDSGYQCVVCQKVIRHMGSCTRHVKERHLGVSRTQQRAQQNFPTNL